jgi:hypothetical protein
MNRMIWNKRFLFSFLINVLFMVTSALSMDQGFQEGEELELKELATRQPPTLVHNDDPDGSDDEFHECLDPSEFANVPPTFFSKTIRKSDSALSSPETSPSSSHGSNQIKRETRWALGDNGETADGEEEQEITAAVALDPLSLGDAEEEEDDDDGFPADVKAKLDAAMLSMTDDLGDSFWKKLKSCRLTKTEWVKLVTILGLTGVGGYYIVPAEASYWVNEFWNVCADESLDCYYAQYLGSNAEQQRINNSIKAIKAILYASYATYLPLSILEIIKTFSPSPSAVKKAMKKYTTRDSLVKWGGEFIAFVIAAYSGILPAITLARQEVDGGNPDLVDSVAIPLAVFFTMEAWISMRALADRVFVKSISWGASKEARKTTEEGYKRLLDIKYALSKMPTDSLHALLEELKEVSENAKRLSEVKTEDASQKPALTKVERVTSAAQSLAKTLIKKGKQRVNIATNRVKYGVEQLKKLASYVSGTDRPDVSPLRKWGTIAAAGTIALSTAYFVWDAYTKDLAALWDNGFSPTPSNHHSAFYTMQYEGFSEYAPVPDNSTTGLFYDTWMNCLTYAFDNKSPYAINDTTGAITVYEASMGPDCLGIPQTDIWGFTPPDDFALTYDNFESWYYFVEESFQQLAGYANGTTPQDQTFSTSGTRFGNIFGGVGAAAISTLTGYQAWLITNTIADLFAKDPVQTEIGQQNKKINAGILAYSTILATLRASPYVMLGYIAGYNNKIDPGLLWTLVVTSGLGRTALNISYFLDKYSQQSTRIHNGAKTAAQFVTCKGSQTPNNRSTELDEILNVTDDLINLFLHADPKMQELLVAQLTGSTEKFGIEEHEEA